MSQIPVSFLATAQSRNMPQKSGKRRPVPCLNNSICIRALRIRNSFDRGIETMGRPAFQLWFASSCLEIDQLDGAEVGAGRHLTTRTNPLIAPLLRKGVQGDQQANIENLETGFLVVATRAPLQ